MAKSEIHCLFSLNIFCGTYPSKRSYKTWCVLKLHCYCITHTSFCFPQGHINISLIDYIGEKIVNNPQIVQDCKAGAFLSVVSGMAAAEYKPVGWNCIQEALMTNTALISKVGEAITLIYRKAIVAIFFVLFCPEPLCE